jgi:hypothetical protein
VGTVRPTLEVSTKEPEATSIAGLVSHTLGVNSPEVDNAILLIPSLHSTEFYDYDDGFNPGLNGLELDSTRSPAWRTGWIDASRDWALLPLGMR